MKRAFLFFAAIALAPMAHAQAPAISPDLSPEVASAAFEDAVLNGCVKAVASSTRIGQLADMKGKVQASNDQERRHQVAAGDEDAVWDVVAARGVVIIKDSDGRCSVMVYGPRAAPAMMALSQKLVAAGFTRMASSGVGRQSLMRAAGGKRIQATIAAIEPGSPGNQSRFPVITASFFAP
jgi:hypothetical protein